MRRPGGRDLGRGYVTDVPYLRRFRELAPAWLDFTATIAGVAPPVCGDGFDWCELGCGQGVTAVVLAATHPRERVRRPTRLRGVARRRERNVPPLRPRAANRS